MARNSGKSTPGFRWQKRIRVGTSGIALLGYATIATFGGGFGVWAATAPLHGAVVASGAVAAVSENIMIQHLEGGIIEKINFIEGDHVKRGDVLFSIDPTESEAQLNRLAHQYAAQRLKAVRLEAERDGKRSLFIPEDLKEFGDRTDIEALFFQEQKEFVARAARYEAEKKILGQRVATISESMAGLRAQKQSIEEQAKIVESEARRKESLLEKGLTNRSEYSELLRSKAALVGQAGEIEAQISSSSVQVIEAKEQIERLTTTRVEEAVADLSTANGMSADLKQQIMATRAVLNRTTVRAPADGIVVRSQYHFPGAVIRPGEIVMELLPTASRLVVDVRVRPEDIAQIRLGQDVGMSFRALNPRTTPRIDGTVTYISADRLLDTRTGAPYYSALLTIKEGQENKITEEQIYPGTPVDCFILTEARTFMDYVSQPIIDSFSTAFREP